MSDCTSPTAEKSAAPGNPAWKRVSRKSSNTPSAPTCNMSDLKGSADNNVSSVGRKSSTSPSPASMSIVAETAASPFMARAVASAAREAVREELRVSSRKASSRTAAESIENEASPRSTAKPERSVNDNERNRAATSPPRL